MSVYLHYFISVSLFLHLNVLNQPVHWGHFNTTPTGLSPSGHPLPSSPIPNNTPSFPVWLFLGCLTLKVKALWCFKTSGIRHSATQHPIVENLTLQREADCNMYSNKFMNQKCKAPSTHVYSRLVQPPISVLFLVP